MDLHSGQCVGYFDIPVDHVYGDSVILDYLASKRISSGDLVVVSPDVGGVARARAFAKKLNDAPLVRMCLGPRWAEARRKLVRRSSAFPPVIDLVSPVISSVVGMRACTESLSIGAS